MMVRAKVRGKNTIIALVVLALLYSEPGQLFGRYSVW
jgi:hypothetical protein